MTAFDPATLRTEFPALALEQNGQPVVYFDGPGGTQVPRQVIEAVSGYYEGMNSNTGGAFITSEHSDAMLAEAHVALADFVNARSPDEIKFGLNMTSHTFNISRALEATIEKGDEVIVTLLDHEANVSPWMALAERGAQIRRVGINLDDCTLDLTDFRANLSPRTKVVAVGYASNAVGTINPVKEIVAMAHEVGALTYVDAVHYAPHGPIDVQDLDCDFLVMSAYKFFGPHVGVLYGKQDVLDSLPAYKVRPAVDRFEIGTQNHEGIAGTLAAVEYLAAVGRRYGEAFAGQFPGFSGHALDLKTGMTAIKTYERTLFERLMDGLERIERISMYGITDRARFDQRTPTLALTFEGTSPREVAEALGASGIFVWDGDFYALQVIEALGLAETGGVVRVGLTHYNTAEEVDRLVGAMAQIAGAGVAV
jgi:cysteine desulfurase family protein (TIGR01976 family)